MKNPKNINSKVIIDIHTHAEGFDFANLLFGGYPFSLSAVQLSKILSENNIDFSVVFPFPTPCYFNYNIYWQTKKYVPSLLDDFPFHKENEYLLGTIESFKLDNLLPLLSISFQDKVDEQIKFLSNCLEKNRKIYGIKLHTSADNSSIYCLEKFEKLKEIAIKYNLPFLVHSGNETFSNPIEVLKVAKINPQIRFCIAHLGRLKKEFFQMLDSDKFDNVFLDMAPFLFMCKNVDNSKQDFLD